MASWCSVLLAALHGRIESEARGVRPRAFALHLRDPQLRDLRVRRKALPVQRLACTLKAGQGSLKLCCARYSDRPPPNPLPLGGGVDAGRWLSLITVASGSGLDVGHRLCLVHTAETDGNDREMHAGRRFFPLPTGPLGGGVDAGCWLSPFAVASGSGTGHGAPVMSFAHGRAGWEVTEEMHAGRRFFPPPDGPVGRGSRRGMLAPSLCSASGTGRGGTGYIFCTRQDGWEVTREMHAGRHFFPPPDGRGLGGGRSNPLFGLNVLVGSCWPFCCPPGLQLPRSIRFFLRGLVEASRRKYLDDDS